MTTWALRILFMLPDNSPIQHDGETLEMGHDGLVLHAKPRGCLIKDSRELVLTRGDFETELAAHECGIRAENALMECGATLLLGVDVGRRTTSSGVTDWEAEQILRNTGIRIRDEVHGLQVHDEDQPTLFHSGSAGLRTSRTARQFVEAFGDAYASNVNLTDDERLTLELFNLSQFETSGRSRLLTLISAVEVLARPEKNPAGVVAVVSDLLTRLKASDLCDPQKGILMSRLGELKRESIGQATRRFVETVIPSSDLYQGKTAAVFIGDCYGLRSDLAHGRRGSGEDEVTEAVSGLQRLVSDLLGAVISRSRQAQDDERANTEHP